ncbi:hypothetical protein TVAG_357580 [Trichomonas vaginalis G3]|uniref:Uncharacterized protein n=1 Tax=Trichomonas vaginalis (strain ATCC PRA-98 / G3) TaxID=412133 RepID=A2G1E0_TRIV3|nr:importin alpha family [Trichomonas vaginalis G3]EAX89020.1 hypothetical protein TVAG_357580 [Trichomonas vaginalis G3]KAI5552913.1 importin alpha family [Trichomonas vaginalis G3]|eukprot:XP_001301950.1 hypothetical protein [Trichomonas vaginalis G3]
MEIFPTGYKQFGKAIEIFDQSLVSTQIDLSTELQEDPLPPEEIDEEIAPIEYYTNLMSAYAGSNQEFLVHSLRKLLGFTSKVEIIDTQELIQQGVLDALIELTKVEDIDISFLAFGVLINLSARTNPRNDPLNSDEFFNFLCEMSNVTSLNLKIFGCLLRCFSNYAENSEENRNKVMGIFPINRLDAIFQQCSNLTVQNEIVHLIYIYSKFSIDPDNGKFIIALCHSVIMKKFNQFVDYALWALLSILHQVDVAVDHIYSPEFADAVCQLIGVKSPKIKSPALLLIGFFLEAGKPVNNIHYGSIVECYSSEDQNVQLNSFYVTKFIAKTMPENIEKLINAGLFNEMYHALNGDFKYNLKKEAAYTLNAVIMQGRKPVVERMCVNGSVSQLIVNFEYEDRDLIIDTLKALDVVFEIGQVIEPRLYRLLLSRFKTIEGFEALDQLLELDDFEITSAVDSIKETYFEDLDIDAIPIDVDSDAVDEEDEN